MNPLSRNGKRSWFNTHLTDFRTLGLLAFLIPSIMRSIPEILMGPFPTGFDTIAYYVPNTLMWLRNGVGWSFLSIAPFLYALLMGITSIGLPIVASIKILCPLFLGLLGVAVYSYAGKALSWSPRKSLLVTIFATLYFVALRVSWDMLRSELALIFLFVTLVFLTKDGYSRKNGVLLSFAMFSVVFAEQLVAVVMLFIVFATAVSLALDKKTTEVRRLVICAVPAVFLFSVEVFASYVAVPNFSLFTDFLGQSSGGFMALYGFNSYPAMVGNTLGFFVFCYLPVLPLVLIAAKKFRGNLQLNAWILWVFITLVLVMISPSAFFAVLPYRWILLLTYPLAFFAAEGFSRLKINALKVVVFLILATFSVSFAVLPNNLTFPYYTIYPLYVPMNMLQNTVLLRDCQDTVNALNWIKENMPSNARLLVHDAFYGWASLTLNSNQLISYGYDNPATYAKQLLENGSTNQLYLIWWIEGYGGHGQPTVSSVFGEVYQSGKIAVYIYNISVTLNASASKYSGNAAS